MWAEARKQERKIRGMLVDYRKRAERRQDFYEKIKADPTQFIQIHGRRCKIHLDPSIASAGDSPAIMMPWQGQQDNLIDRFDVRAHLDFIPPLIKSNEPSEVTQDERQCNYESYRILAQNDFLGITEDKYLHQLHLEEQFGVNAQQLEMDKAKKKKEKENSNAACGAAIGYTYDNCAEPVSTFNSANIIASAAGGSQNDEESDSDIDVDVALDVTKVDTQQAHELNSCGQHYGMLSNDFYSFLTKDADEAESLRMAREEEQEKIILCGRKSRRERRAQREKRVAGRAMSPPSYAAKEEPTKPIHDDGKNDSDSRSPTPENSGRITYITSFGGEDELIPHSKISINFSKTNKGAPTNQFQSNTLGSAVLAARDTYAEKVKQNLDKLKDRQSPKKPIAYQRRGRSRRRSYSNRYKSRRRRYSSSSLSSSSCDSRKRRRKRRSSDSCSSKSSSRSSTQSSDSSRSFRSGTPDRKYKRKTSEVNSKPSVEKSTKAAEAPVPTIEPKTVSAVENVSQHLKEEPRLSENIPIKKYYGRKRDDQSSSESETSYDDDNSNSNEKDKFTSTASSKDNSIGKSSNIHIKNALSDSKKVLNPRDRLKKKMQILLNKQYKADKMAEIEKNERQVQQQQERDDEMREMALRLRRRQRELRHKYGSPGADCPSNDSDSDTRRSISRESSRNSVRNKKRHHSRSRSNSSPRRYHSRRDNYRVRRDRERSPRRSRSPRNQHRHSRDKSRHRRSRERSRRSNSRDTCHRRNLPENRSKRHKLVDY